MSAQAPARRSRLALVALAVGLASCAGCAGLALWLGQRAQQLFASALGVDDTWQTGVLSRGDVERQFELELPAGSVTVYHRSLGFQDPLLEVLLPLADRAAFERANGLTEAPSTEDVSAADEQVRAVAAPRGTVTAVDLEGLTDVPGADGGGVDWFRHGCLLVYEDQVWLYLVAFGT